jgi:hypothetical protein
MHCDKDIVARAYGKFGDDFCKQPVYPSNVLINCRPFGSKMVMPRSLPYGSSFKHMV